MANDFTYYAPTRVVFGKGTEAQTGTLVKEQGCKKVLLHYGSGSARKSGLLGRIEKSLEEAGIAYVSLGGVVPNPRLSLVYEGIDLCKREGVDFILAVGGGSVIDSSKAIGYGVANEGDVWELYDRKRQARACLPIGVVLTIAAAGSEMSASCVITKDEGGIKRGYASDLSRAKFAVMNPELTMTLPDYQTACGCTDILMHTMERYFTNGGHMELTDTLAEGLMRTVLRNAEILRDHPDDYDARAEVMWAGSLSHNDLTGCGIREKDFASHAGAGRDMSVKTAWTVLCCLHSVLCRWNRAETRRKPRCGGLRPWRRSIAGSACRLLCMSLASIPRRNSSGNWQRSAALPAAAGKGPQRYCSRRTCWRSTAPRYDTTFSKSAAGCLHSGQIKSAGSVSPSYV